MEIRSLPVPLTDEDLKLRGDELATKVKEWHSVDATRKDAAAEFKAKLDGIDTAINSLSTVVKERKEYRPVECQWVEHWKTYMMELIRSDTGERVDARPMTAGERQPKLFPVGDKKAAPKKGEKASAKKDASETPSAG